MATQKVRSDMILRQLQKRHVDRNEVFLTEVKNGQSYVPKGQLLKLDALAIKRSWANPCFTGYEIKVDRGDFIRDTKWPGYMRYCNEFYFACPKGLIEQDELPKEVGLVYYDPENGKITTKRKAVHRFIELQQEFLMYIIMAKTDSDRHPFFSENREYFEAMREDKHDKDLLGRYVAAKTAELLNSLKSDKKRIERLEDDSQTLNEIKKVLHAHGISTYWNISESLNKALSTKMDPKLLDKVERIGKLATEIGQIIQVKQVG